MFYLLLVWVIAILALARSYLCVCVFGLTLHDCVLISRPGAPPPSPLLTTDCCFCSHQQHVQVAASVRLFAKWLSNNRIYCREAFSLRGVHQFGEASSLGQVRPSKRQRHPNVPQKWIMKAPCLLEFWDLTLRNDCSLLCSTLPVDRVGINTWTPSSAALRA